MSYRRGIQMGPGTIIWKCGIFQSCLMKPEGSRGYVRSFISERTQVQAKHRQHTPLLEQCSKPCWVVSLYWLVNGISRNRLVPIESSVNHPLSTIFPDLWRFQKSPSFTGWWFGTCFIFPFSWECHDPNWWTHIFQRGRSTTNQKSHIKSLTIIINHGESGASC